MTGMDENFFENLRKAARAELTDYADAGQWALAQEWYVRRNRAAHESYEAAFARLLDSDPEMKAMDRLRRQARDVGKIGRPRKYQPQVEQARLSDAEDRLTKRALARAYREQTSFERAFVAEIDTPEGRELYRQTRGAKA